MVTVNNTEINRWHPTNENYFLSTKKQSDTISQKLLTDTEIRYQNELNHLFTSAFVRHSVACLGWVLDPDLRQILLCSALSVFWQPQRLIPSWDPIIPEPSDTDGDGGDG